MAHIASVFVEDWSKVKAQFILNQIIDFYKPNNYLITGVYLVDGCIEVGYSKIDDTPDWLIKLNYKRLLCQLDVERIIRIKTKCERITEMYELVIERLREVKND